MDGWMEDNLDSFHKNTIQWHSKLLGSALFKVSFITNEFSMKELDCNKETTDFECTATSIRLKLKMNYRLNQFNLPINLPETPV